MLVFQHAKDFSHPCHCLGSNSHAKLKKNTNYVNPQPVFRLPKMPLNYFAIVLFLQDFPYNAGINRRVRGILQPNKTPKKQIEDFPQSLP